MNTSPDPELSFANAHQIWKLLGVHRSVTELGALKGRVKFRTRFGRREYLIDDVERLARERRTSVPPAEVCFAEIVVPSIDPPTPTDGRAPLVRVALDTNPETEP